MLKRASTSLIMKRLFSYAFLLGAALLLNSQAETTTPSPLRIKVKDIKGQPVEGATVILQGSRDNMLSLQGMSPAEERRMTDAEGLATFATPEMPLFTVTTHKPGLSLGWNLLMPGFPGGDAGDQILEMTLTPPASVSGIVQEADGKPIPGAEVWVSLGYRLENRSSSVRTFPMLNSKQGHKYLATRSGDDGRFCLEGLPSDAALELGAAKPGLALDQPPPHMDPSNLSLRAGQSNVVLTLKPAGSIEGMVVTETSEAPVAGARVSLASAGLITNIRDPVITGQDGRFHLQDLCAGEHLLRTTIGASQFADWVCDQVTAQVVPGTTNRQVKIKASRGGVLEVSVRDAASSQPKDGVSLITVPEDSDFFSSIMWAQTEQGQAKFRLSPGNYLVMASQKGFTPRQERITVESGQTNQLEIILQADQKITGTVLTPDGKPAAGVQIAASSSTRAKTQSDAEGKFAFLKSGPESGGPPGQELECMVVARDLERNLAAMLSLDEDATNVVLRLEPGIVMAGRVTDSQGKGIAKTEIHLSLQTDRRGVPLTDSIPVHTNGSFEIKGLPANQRYYVNVRAPGHGQDNRSLASQDTAGPRIELDPFELPLADQRVAGVVLDAEDKPVAGASIYTYGPKQPGKSGRTDAKGRFSIEGVCAGAINLSANVPRGGGHGSVGAEGGDTNITVRLGLSSGVVHSSSAGTRKISGTVTDPEGQPAPKVVVNYFPFHQTEKITDAEGRFKLTYNADEWRHTRDLQRLVIARDLARNLAAALEVDEDTTNAEVRLAPAWTVAGRVTGMDGKTIRNAEIYVSLMAGSIGSSIGQVLRCDANGGFEVKALPIDRRYYINVSAPGFGRDNRNLEFGESEMRLELEPFQLVVADQRIAGVVVDENEKPVSGANLYCYENKQPQLNGQTDSKGRFRFDKVCPGSIRLNVSSRSGAYTRATVEAGDTNIVIQLTASSGGRPAPPRTITLKGKPLPDLAPLGLAAADAPAGSPVLVLLMDAEQRPSRRALKRIEDQADLLKDKGLAVLVIQAGAMPEDAFNDWRQDAALAFPVGRMKEQPEKARATWGASALPWLILTDKDHRVVAEGFAPEEIEAKLGDMTK